MKHPTSGIVCGPLAVFAAAVIVAGLVCVVVMSLVAGAVSWIE